LNIIPLGGGRVGLYILDVSGHGVASALLSVSLSRLLSPPADASSILMGGDDGGAGTVPQRPDGVTPPADVAARLNHLFPFDVAIGQFATLMYGVLDVSTGDFRHVCAGHAGPLHVPVRGPAVILESPGFPIGVADDPYAERILHLAAGDRLYLYSDGLPDAMSPHGENFGDARLLQTIDQTRQQPLKQAVATLLTKIAEWQGGERPQDDISLLALEMS
jgi:sigma-B regulation protein RsbU (phosphoserine phosphatase)